MSNIDPLRFVVRGKCPHCKKEMLIEQNVSFPNFFREEDLADTKKKILETMEKLDIEESSKIEIRKWINDPEFLVAPEDIENVLNNIKTEFAKK